jgi:hypothetical protein
VANALAGSVTATYSFYLKTDIEEKGDYVFSHWTKGNETIKEGEPNFLYEHSEVVALDKAFKADYNVGKTTTVTYNGKNPSFSATFTAHWVQPQVTGADKETLDLGTIINPNGSATGQVTFTLYNDVSFHDYTVVVSEGFEATLDTYEERSGKQS